MSSDRISLLLPPEPPVNVVMHGVKVNFGFPKEIDDMLLGNIPPRRIVIDPNYGHQGFYVDTAGALSLTHLTIQNGVSSVGAGVGVNTGGTLALTDVTMRWNSATSRDE